MKLLFKALTALIMSVSIFANTANAGLITYSDYTEDTTNSLAFLDLGIISSGTYSAIDVTVSYGGYDWELATVDQFTSFISEVTGLSIPSWTGSNLTDFDMSSTHITNVLTYLDGDQSGHNDYYLKGAYGWIHHQSYDDFHVYSTASTDNRVQQGIYVRSIDVPEPSTLAILALGMIGLASRRFKKQS